MYVAPTPPHPCHPDPPAPTCALPAGTTAHHLPDLADNPAANVVALVEPLADRRQAVSEQYGVPAFATVEELVAAGIEVDGAIVASAHVAHFDNALACVKAGWHVLVEKPMTTRAADAATLVATASEMGVSGAAFSAQQVGGCIR